MGSSRSPAWRERFSRCLSQTAIFSHPLALRDAARGERSPSMAMGSSEQSPVVLVEHGMDNLGLHLWRQVQSARWAIVAARGPDLLDRFNLRQRRPSQVA